MINEITTSTTETKFKDRLFKAIFGRNNTQSKQWRLELYNALRGTNYTNPDDLELNTIENVIYLTMRNDISFLVDSQMTLFEQQSTFNPNMPLRGLMYFAQLYQMHLSRQGKTLFRTSLVKIPNPKFIVFYNSLDYNIILRKPKIYTTQKEMLSIFLMHSKKRMIAANMNGLQN